MIITTSLILGKPKLIALHDAICRRASQALNSKPPKIFKIRKIRSNRLLENYETPPIYSLSSFYKVIY